jgi:DNA repair protein RecN (Recombination protein N)
VTRLEAEDVVSELVRMLGAEEADPAARRHASELLRAA